MSILYIGGGWGLMSCYEEETNQKNKKQKTRNEMHPFLTIRVRNYQASREERFSRPDQDSQG